MSAASSATAHAPRLTQRPAFWAGLAITALGFALVATLSLTGMRGAQPLPQLGALPDFTFTRQDGQPFGREQLLGQAYVANFVFTRCPTVCPVFTQKMAKLQERTAALGPKLRLVSFSVDPKYDTPERLAAYGQKYRADFARWSFLTGDYERLKDTIVQGFKISMGREAGASEDDIPSIFHGTHFVLVDATGQIRGYYDSNDPEATERLMGDAQRLASAAK
ncbi:SCO family protein [Corallococcus sp. H22C18031201]|uniref:SCO family protein n=1 Tax=Citreicoccus inhibens TaxID=2849499 RepID=UPI000E73509E|nr:SCO family protein [Citreicoccus inhibens]MBU8897315.1 SCO family protein [Citreicoccus inhibens]RJS21125.1 SCO family protein [Corallococcus sp. H22C18031201]